MLIREIIAVCSQIHTKHINALCGQNMEFVNVKVAVQKLVGFEAVNGRCTESCIILMSLYGLSPCLRLWKINKRWQQELRLSAGGGSAQQFFRSMGTWLFIHNYSLVLWRSWRGGWGAGYLAHAARLWSAHSTLLPLLNKHGVARPHQRSLSATFNLWTPIASARAQ